MTEKRVAIPESTTGFADPAPVKGLFGVANARGEQLWNEWRGLEQLVGERLAELDDLKMCVAELTRRLEHNNQELVRAEQRTRRTELESSKINMLLRQAQGDLAAARADRLRLESNIVEIRQSTSWRIAAPLRIAKRAMVSGQDILYRTLSGAAHWSWSRLPLSPDQRRSVKNVLFRTQPSIFSPTATYQAWKISIKETSPQERASASFVTKLNAPPPEKSARLICFYLPQFHPIPENDQWWGVDFTEWTNVRPTQPLFHGHYQPHVPADELGYYDLRDTAVQLKQIELAKLYGIEGFCFYFYWFGGKRLLDTPTENYLNNPKLDLPFCLCWANENWTRRWDGLDSEILIGQAHSPDDDLAFIAHVSKYMRDARYIRIEGKPVLVVYRPSLLPSAKKTAERWRTWCRDNGLGEIFLAYTQSFEAVDPKRYGFDGAIEFPPNNSAVPDLTGSVTPVNNEFAGTVYDWDTLVNRSESYADPDYIIFRGVCPAWDNSARRKNRGTAFINSTPERFGAWLLNAIDDTIRRFDDPSKRLVFLNAWNEWAEGAHLEPDVRHGYAYLQATRMALARTSRTLLELPTVAATVHVPRTAIAIHAYYPDILDELLTLVGKLEKRHKLFVTTDAQHADEVRRALVDVENPTRLMICENRGRDILPFLQSYRAIREEHHDFVVKMHTKKSPHRVDGDAWRHDLYDQLLGPATFERSINGFLHDSHLGMIGPAGHYVSIETYLGSNKSRIFHLGHQMGLSDQEILDQGFFAGTMFIARTLALEPAMSLAISPDQFESESGQVDGTLAHALERIFCLSAYAARFRVEEVARSSITDIDLSPIPSPLNQYRHA